MILAEVIDAARLTKGPMAAHAGEKSVGKRMFWIIAMRSIASENAFTFVFAFLSACKASVRT